MKRIRVIHCRIKGTEYRYFVDVEVQPNVWKNDSVHKVEDFAIWRLTKLRKEHKALDDWRQCIKADRTH
jgi:hypothetical protein